MSEDRQKRRASIMASAPYLPIIPDPVQRWVLVVGAWSLFGFVMATLSHFLSASLASPLSWSTSLLQEMLYAYLWLLLTPVIFRIVWKFPLDVRTRWMNIFLHLMFSVFIAFLHKLSYHVILSWAEPILQMPVRTKAVFPAVYSYLDYGAMIYWIFVLIQLSVNYARMYQEKSLRAAQLETQLVQAQLHALQMQLNPHFLFNTLNTILVLIETNPPLARETLLKFSELLRIVLDSKAEQTVTLDNELEFLQKYLEIEQLRFTDRLNISIDAEERTLKANVPFLILQPLAENAIRHGVTKRRGDAELIVRSFQTNGTLVLEVENSAPPKGESINERIGLSNTRERLEKLYGNRAVLRLQHTAAGRFISHISMPFETKSLSSAQH